MVMFEPRERKILMCEWSVIGDHLALAPTDSSLVIFVG